MFELTLLEELFEYDQDKLQEYLVLCVEDLGNTLEGIRVAEQTNDEKLLRQHLHKLLAVSRQLKVVDLTEMIYAFEARQKSYEQIKVTVFEKIEKLIDHLKVRTLNS
ncbi:MAG: hypothetical protein OEX02_04455 [Cyclobacteriaceae bacterium]|nr:hypothetical protein [Cyclobacteriaceae bacterium]